MVADGHGEGDPVRVGSGRACGLGPQRAKCLVDDQEGEQLLAGQVGGLDLRMNSVRPSAVATVAVYSMMRTTASGACTGT
jgi:hypothetical protein